MKHKAVSILTSLALLVTSAFIVPSASAETDSESVKILPLGDSITDGYWESGSYRKYLDYALEQKGYSNIDFVGPKGSDSESFSYNGKTVEYDGNYAGYSGYAIQNISGTETRSGILEVIQESDMIKTYSPDIVLLQIGTNDILSAYNDGITDRLENLINVIFSGMPSGGTVFVTTIPNIDLVEIDSWLWAYGDVKWSMDADAFHEIVQGYIDSYNASIRELVTKLRSEGRNIMFADINSVVDYTSDLYDGIHPNEQGYEKMGSYWAEVLDSYLDGGQPPETQPTTSETTTTTTSTTTTTTTTSTTTTTTTTSTSTTTTTSTSTTTTTETTEVSYSVADLVQLQSYILRRTKTADKTRLDMDRNDRLDAFDLVLLRKELIK